MTNQIIEFEIIADVRRAGGCIGKGDAKLVAGIINQWKCDRAAIIYYSSFGMSRDVEKFRSSVKPVAEAAVHDALITGRQVFLLNMLGNWPAYPELEEPCKEGRRQKAGGRREEFERGFNPAQFLATFSRDYGGGLRPMFPLVTGRGRKQYSFCLLPPALCLSC